MSETRLDILEWCRWRSKNVADTNFSVRLAEAAAEIERLRDALERLRDCDWTITLPDRMDAVREIARAALEGTR